MKACLVVNPKSGFKSSINSLEIVKESLEKNRYLVTEHLINEQGDAKKFAHKAVKDKFDIVVAVGGDGTINGVINGLAGSSVALGIIPTGTANVFAKELGIPKWHPVKRGSLQKAAEIIINGKVQKIDLGKVKFEDGSERYFSMWCGIGVDAAITAAKRPPPQSIHGRFFNYLRWASSIINISANFRGVESEIIIDAEKIKEKINSIIVANGRLYANYFTLSENARLDDGILDFILVKGNALPAILKTGFKSMKTRRLYSDLKITQAKNLTVNSRSPLPVHVDAEEAGITPVEIEVVPKSLSVIVPSNN